MTGQAGSPATTRATWSVNRAYEISQQVDATGPAISTFSYSPAHELTGLSIISGTTPTATALARATW